MHLAVSAMLVAQSDLGRISGFVKDPSGATMQRQGHSSKQHRRPKSPDNDETKTGYYVVTNHPAPGLYTMTVEVPGFQRYETS